MIIELYLFYVFLSFFLMISGLFLTSKNQEGNRKNPLVAILFLLLAMGLFFTLSKASFNIEKIDCSTELETETAFYVYGDNYTGYHWDYEIPGPSTNDVNLFHENRSYYYTTVCTDSQIVQQPAAVIFGIMASFTIFLTVIYSIMIFSEEGKK